MSAGESGATVAGYFQSKRILYSDGAPPAPATSESMPPQGTMSR